MRVLLLKDIADIGQEGEVHEVSDGHARNFLFPKHLAVPATDHAQREVRERVEAAARESERELEQLQRLAEAVGGQEITITAPASATGTLYGSIGPTAVATALTAAGFRVDEQWLQMPEHIKEIGEHTVDLRLPHGLEAEVTVIVEADH
ncbi:MAG: 50S ribosomal protein L9 [bacterium]|nr:50S ribosomal protein L9 [bacterium]